MYIFPSAYFMWLKKMSFVQSHGCSKVNTAIMFPSKTFNDFMPCGKRSQGQVFIVPSMPHDFLAETSGGRAFSLLKCSTKVIM